MNTTLFLGLVSLIIIGSVLFLLGKRGRKLNNHPQCRDCGFDLDGVYPKTITCPECGSGLRRPKAVRSCVRARMPIVMTLGLLIALLPLAPLFMFVYATATGTNMTKHTPTGLLLVQLRYSSQQTQKQIAGELLDRLIRKELDKAQSARIAENILERQADPAMPWDDEWGDVMERLQLNGELSKEQLARFNKQSLVLSAKCRPAVRAGDTLPILFTVESTRVLPSSQNYVLAGVSSATIGTEKLAKAKPKPNDPYRMNGVFYFYLYGKKVNNGWYANNTSQQRQLAAVVIPKTMEPGIKTVEVTVSSKMQDQQAGWSGSPTVRATDKNVNNQTFSLQVNILAPDAEQIRLKIPSDDESKKMRALLKKSVLTSTVTSGIPLPVLGSITTSPAIGFQLQTDDSPMTPYAFDVYVRLGDTETKLGSITSSPCEGSPYSFFQQGGMAWLNAAVPNLKRSDSQVDLIFRPSTQAALGTIDLSEIYGQEVTLSKVRLQKEHDSARPTVVAPDEPDTETEPPKNP